MPFIVHRLPVLSDNYIFLLHDPDRGEAAVVDPAEAAPVLQKLAEWQVPLVAIFNTHHHHDHVGGNAELKRAFPELVVYGGSEDLGRIPGQQVFLHAGDRVSFAGQEAEIFFIPGHTKAHIAYYFPETHDLFCGDTLFAGGCGRLFEGTPAQMVASLSQLRHLPDQTRVWCAHEYTLGNLKFALTVDRENALLQARLQEVQILRHQGIPTIPSTIGLEKSTNPFMRWDQPALKAATHQAEPDRVLAQLRGMKDIYAG